MNLQSEVLEVISGIEKQKKMNKKFPAYALDKEVKDRMLKLGYSYKCTEKEIERLVTSNIIRTGDTINYRYIEVL